MDTSFWPQPESFFSCQFSVLSGSTESSIGSSSPSPFDGWLLWIGGKDTETAWVVPEQPCDDDKPAQTHNPEPLGGAMLESAVNARDRIRLALAIAPFQTLVRPTCEDARINTVVWNGESAMNAFGHVCPLGRRFDPDEPQLYVRPRCYAPTLGRFLPRDPR